MNIKNINLATRESELALYQTNYIKNILLKDYPDINYNIIGMTTLGDQILDKKLSAFTEKGIFTKELDISLLNKSTDIAVHSLKDLATTLPNGLSLGAIVERVDVEDVVIMRPDLIQKGIKSLQDLPENSIIGTSSLRRRALLAKYFPKLVVDDVRGNLKTRISKLDEGKYSAIILARAGINRLELTHRITQILPTDSFPHAVGQAALGIVCRTDDIDRLKPLLNSLHHLPTSICCTAERTLLRVLEGGCKVPIACSTNLNRNDNSLTFRACVISLEGCIIEETLSEIVDTEAQAIELGIKMSGLLLEKGAKEILDKIKGGL